MNRHPLYYLIQNSTLMSSLAKNYGTPLYIYSEKRLLANLDRLNNALKTNFNKYHICYALKANSNPALITKMKNHLTSLGADCSSPGELHAAKLGGIDHHECIYTGNYESQEDLQAAYNSGCHINLDDINSFHRLTKIGIPDEISFRLNPGFGKGTFSQIITGGENAKFGVPDYDIVNAYRTAKNAGVKRFGIQCMTGSGILDPDYFSALIKDILKNTNVIHQELGIRMDYISLGGGFGIPYQDGETPLDFDRVFKKVGDVFNAHFKKDAKPSFWIEPGKSVVGDTGLLLTKVTGIKKSYKTFIGLDAGMETLMRPALYGAYHRIYKVGVPDAKSTNMVDITGRICENTDRLAVDRLFPKVSEGDLIAIMDTGAYGYAMAHQFNTRPRPAEVLINGEQSCLIRERETIQDIFRTCDV
ncbi:MAG TPA: diaminopimelate decarboxylase [Candidatus Marinimicrobia bacterium]|nr:diaminopimelate decarboxylase [Candidatus Neomarinimicrobiota bacterium]